MNEDVILDAVIALWREADTERDSAEVYEAAMNNSIKAAEDKEEAAEILWRPLADLHPEWFDALKDGQDPPMNPRDYDPYRVLGCAIVITSIVVVIAFFARTIEEMRHLLRTDA